MSKKYDVYYNSRAFDDYEKALLEIERHKICEKFRKKYYEIQEVKPAFEFVSPDEVDKILDQIERGER